MLRVEVCIAQKGRPNGDARRTGSFIGARLVEATESNGKPLALLRDASERGLGLGNASA
jgi:hypothetical protein